jgi:hypothetical protein
MAHQRKGEAERLTLTSLQLVQRWDDRFKTSFWEYSVTAN